MSINLSRFLSIALPALLFWLNFALTLCEVPQLQADRKANAPSAPSAMLPAVSEVLSNSQASHKELPTAAVQSNEHAPDVSNLDSNVTEIGPRIALESLPFCRQGFKLFGGYCRKEV